MPSGWMIGSVLLRYPDRDLVAARSEIAAAISELDSPPQRDALEAFIAGWTAMTVGEMAEAYVATFDLRKRASLYLTYYTHGDTRKRGMALLRLKKLYRAAGFPWDNPELPDYLPAMLEFAAIAPEGYGAQVLGEHRAELETLRLALHDAGSLYMHVLDAVAALLGDIDEPQRAKVSELIRNGPPQEQVGLEPFAPPEVMPIGAHP
ncbi:MAG: nitrate reductase molybdenum cofactor assembly chaperone [Solirubrobacterales bacterium]